ncbi:MAG TPA: hypothetical protein VES38_07210 [Methylotenera sp.]|nr:hypothetical protein [Methylotenera sp.]
MKLTVDCALDGQLLGLQSNAALAYLLSKAKITQLNTPLEALICAQFGLPPCSEIEPDYPIAAIAAAADGLDVSDAYWLRADPVNLVLQRDCFSLGEPVPLPVEITDAEKIIASLNQHFSPDGLTFFIGDSGACYVRSTQALQIKTTLPSVAAGKNIHPFMPQGLAGGKWLSVLNEIQMLLHEHPVNLAREAKGERTVNSLWLSGGGQMPQSSALKNDADLIVANSAFYAGLARLSAIQYQSLPADLNSLLSDENQHVRLQLTDVQNSFELMLTALKNRTISQLSLNLGFYEKSLVAEITPLDIYKFWRSNKPILNLI